MIVKINIQLKICVVILYLNIECKNMVEHVIYQSRKKFTKTQFYILSVIKIKNKYY